MSIDPNKPFMHALPGNKKLSNKAKKHLLGVLILCSVWLPFIIYAILTYDKIEFFSFGRCSGPTVRMHLGGLPAERLAIIEPADLANKYRYAIKILLVDGEEIRPDTCKIELLSGEHQLVIYTEDASGFSIYGVNIFWLIKENEPHTLTFKAEAGHVYKVYYQYIEDYLTGTVYAE